VPELGAWNLVISGVVAMAAAGVFSLLIGLPCLRLRGDYLAIATLGFGEIVRMMLSNIEFPGAEVTGGEPFGGATGINIPSTLMGAEYTADWASKWLIWGALILTYVFFLNLKRSGIGRALMCIREDEIAARAMGIHVPRLKILSFLLSAVFAGLAGALYIHNARLGLTASPGDFTLFQTIEMLLIVVLGGLGSFSGSLLAALVLKALPELLRLAPTVGGVDLGQNRQLLYAILLIVLIRLVPNGLMGAGEWPSRRRVRSTSRRGAGT
jgi:branched-chain amino acid transport system permease protein